MKRSNGIHVAQNYNVDAKITAE